MIPEILLAIIGSLLLSALDAFGCQKDQASLRALLVHSRLNFRVESQANQPPVHSNLTQINKTQLPGWTLRRSTAFEKSLMASKMDKRKACILD